MKDNTSPLSMNRFRLANGDFKAVVDMSHEEKVAFNLGQAMKETIETLEMSIQNDRIFNRAKFSIMTIYHKLYDGLKVGKDG